MQIAFTGPRQLTLEQERKIYRDLCYFITTDNAHWHVGDAPGLDNFITRAAGYFNKPLTVYEVEGSEKWQYAARSQRMINAIAKLNDPWLYAFPNKLCPTDITPKTAFSGQGSGTWSTVAYAHKKGIQIYFFPLFKTKYGDRSWVPSWMKPEKPQQLSLF